MTPPSLFCHHWLDAATFCKAVSRSDPIEDCHLCSTNAFLACLQIREKMQSMHNTIMAAGKIAINDLDAETMLITCTN